MEDIRVYLKGDCVEEISTSLFKINENIENLVYIETSVNKIRKAYILKDVRTRVEDLLYSFILPGEDKFLGIQNMLALEVMLKGNLQKGVERMIEVCEGYILGLEKEPDVKYINLPVSELIETLRYMLEELGVPRRNQK